MSTQAKAKTEELVIVYGVNKDLEVTDDETILEVKKGALGLFDIPESEMDNFVLRAKVKGDKDEQLDEAQTVGFYKLHNKQKVTLAAGKPFGGRWKVAGADLTDLSPEEQSKSLVRGECDKLVAQSDFFGWHLRLHDAGDYYVIFVRIEKRVGRIFVLKLECDDYAQQAPRAAFINPELFETADETTQPEANFYPTGENMVLDRGPLPVMCIKGHRDYYGGWHDGWSNPPAHDHSLYQHVVNARNALLDIWS